jgi:hypothetical protein
MSLLRQNGTQVLSYRPDGTDRRWMGTVGHVNALKYGWVTPGGPNTASWNLMIEADVRTEITDEGRIVELHRGGGRIWEGIMQEPVPTPGGWQCTATGAGQYGANFVAAYTDMWPTGQPDEALNQAIARGLRWNNPGIGTSSGMWGGASGTSNSPGGGVTLCSVAIPAGTWEVTWITGFTSSTAGSASAADNNNFGLYLGASLEATAVVDAVDNGVELYVQAPVQITVPSGGSTLEVKTIGAGSSGMQYYAMIPPAGVWLGQEVDSAAQNITSLNNLCCTYGGLTWFVNTTQTGNYLSLFPLPVVPDRLLVSTSPVSRTIAGQPTTVFERYEISADSITAAGTSDVAVYGTTSSIDQPSATRYGPTEVFIDLSQAGVMSQAAAQQVGTNLLSRFLRANFSGQFTVGPGMLMTMGGQPVDLGSEHSLHVYQLVLTDFGYGGEVTLSPPITFLGGEYDYDDDAQAGTVTPFQYLASSINDLLEAASTMLPTAFQDS